MDDLLILLNHWWKEGRVRKDLAKPFKRGFFDESLNLMDNRQTVILSGLRRVGKTTLMFQLMDHLINQNVRPVNILYFSFDEKVEGIRDILYAYHKITKVDWKKERLFLFLDEIQKLEDWSNKLKLIYDNFPNIKFVVSGSGSVFLERDAIENLAGRYFLVNVTPLSFREFAEMTAGGIENVELWRSEVIALFEEYVKKPFPEIVDWSDELLIRRYIRESVIEKIIRRDLPEKFRGVNQDILLRLVEIFYSNPGMYLNVDELSKNLKTRKKTLLNHLFYLEFSYLIRIVRNFRVSEMVTSRKMRRIYPYHWSLTYGFHSRVEKGRLMESVVASIIDARYYWRKYNKEVDFLIVEEGDITPLEVKAKKKVDAGDVKSLIYFMKRNRIKKAYVAYDGVKEAEIKVKELEIKAKPFWSLALDSPLKRERNPSKKNTSPPAQ